MDTQEWLNGNANRRFPFAEASADAAGIDFDVLSNWALDLRVFISAHEEVECWISSIGLATGPLSMEAEMLTLGGEELYMQEFFDEPLPHYQIVVSNDTGEVGVFFIPVRTDWATPDIGRKVYGFDGRKVLMVVPGETWDDPSLLGLTELDPEILFTSPEEIESTRIHPTNVNTDIRSFCGFYLEAPYYDSEGVLIEVDEEVPAVGDGSAVAFNRIVAGYNIQLGQDEDFLDFNLVPGAGEGLYPCQDLDCKPKLRFLNGVGPNDQGNFTLEFFDCLRHSGLTDIDPETGFPDAHGIKVYSDCMPCCDCEDYNHVALAISRMSGKFKDANIDLNWTLLRSQYYYDEGIALINAQSSGLVVPYTVEIKPDGVCISLYNASNIPIYAVMSLANPDGIMLLDSGQPWVMEGVITAAPPLKNLSSSNKDTGNFDILEVEDWDDKDEQYTIGFGDDFDPIPPAEFGEICFYSQDAREKLQALEDLCANLQLVLGGGLLGEALLDEDAEYQAILAELDTTIIDADCLDDTDFGEEPNDDCYRCQVQTYTDGIIRQELRDKLLARKYELMFGWSLAQGLRVTSGGDVYTVAGDELTMQTAICGGPVATAEMLSLIARLRGTADYVDEIYKTGSLTCEEGGTGDCSAPIYEAIAQSQIRSQALERSDIYVDLPSILNKQIVLLTEQLEDCLRGGMFADLISVIDICTTAIYGSYNFSCKAICRQFDVAQDDSTTDYDCLEKIVNLVSLATERN